MLVMIDNIECSICYSDICINNAILNTEYIQMECCNPPLTDNTNKKYMCVQCIDKYLNELFNNNEYINKYSCPFCRKPMQNSIILNKLYTLFYNNTYKILYKNLIPDKYVYFVKTKLNIIKNSFSFNTENLTNKFIYFTGRLYIMMNNDIRLYYIVLYKFCEIVGNTDFKILYKAYKPNKLPILYNVSPNEIYSSSNIITMNYNLNNIMSTANIFFLFLRVFENL